MGQIQNWQELTANAKRVIPNVSDAPFQVKEAINVLRGNLQMNAVDKKIIAVTSAVIHEGKSSISFRLARSLAALNKQTLYIDCDIRNSATISRYRIKGVESGLGEYLDGTQSLISTIYKTDMPCFDMIFTGMTNTNPSQLFSDKPFSKMLSLLREHYDYIIVDTPPLNPVIDGTLIAKECDGAILIIESGMSEVRHVLHARQQLENAEVEILGTVLNKVGTRKSGYRYGMHKYGKYGKYGRYGYGKRKF